MNKNPLAGRYSLLVLIGLAVLALIKPPTAKAQLLVYTFNEGSGTTIANTGSLGSAANLTIGGAFAGIIAWNTNTVSGTGSAIQNITGATRGAQPGYISGNGTSLNTGLSQFTLTMWVNLSALTNGDRLFSFFDGAAGFELQLSSISGENSALNLFVDTGSVASTTSTDLVGQWTFLALTYDGTAASNNVSFYSGTSSTSASLLGSVRTLNQGPLNLLGATPANTALRVGNPSTTTADRSPAGMFDNVQVYGTVLDAPSIEALRVAAVPEPSTYILLGLGALVFIQRRRI